MSNIEKNDHNDEEEGEEINDLGLPRKQVQSIFEELEIMAMQKGNRSSFDFSSLDKEQKDKVLDTMVENEKNTIRYHTERLAAIKEIELKKIDASVITQRTLRSLLIGFGLVVVPIITLLILFFKDNYFIPWLTFLTGILGGFGLSTVTNTFLTSKKQKNPIREDEDQE